MMRWMLVLGISGVAAVAAPLEAQGRGRGRDGAGVPPGQRPAAGQCRIWIDGVAPGQQPAPTDCATAERDRPANARVIYGDDVRDGKGKSKGKKAKDGRDRDEDTDARKRRDRDEDTDDRRDRADRDRRDRADRRDGRGRDTCVDRNRDGRCDVTPRTGTGTGGIGGYPRTLPQMVNTAILTQGSRSREATVWLRGVPATGRAVDNDGNRIPEQIDWLASDGQVIQKWYDDDRDGRADRVEIYQDGRLIGTRR